MPLTDSSSSTRPSSRSSSTGSSTASRSPVSLSLQHRRFSMPMIDVYAREGTFKDKHTLAQELATAVMRWEQVPELPMFFDNTAAFVHDLPAEAISNVNGDSNYVRVQVLTPINVLDREKQLGVVKELTEIVAGASWDPTLASRTWVLLTESPEGGWGIAGHANTSEDLVALARSEIAAATKAP